jgi:hypothetical protein
VDRAIRQHPTINQSLKDQKMKKSYLFLLAFTLMLATACNKEREVTPQNAIQSTLTEDGAKNHNPGHTRPTQQSLSTPVTGDIIDPLTGAVIGTFSGIFNITGFAEQGGQLVAIGELTNVVFDLIDGAVLPEGFLAGLISSITQLLVSDISGTCQILDLTLGPLELDLLGLQVFLDEVNLNITAQAGPGNLLGNLLCAVANLLNAGGPLSQLANLLNQITAILS